jgi:hypothetical protein
MAGVIRLTRYETYARKRSLRKLWKPGRKPRRVFCLAICPFAWANLAPAVGFAKSSCEALNVAGRQGDLARPTGPFVRRNRTTPK